MSEDQSVYTDVYMMAKDFKAVGFQTDLLMTTRSQDNSYLRPTVETTEKMNQPQFERAMWKQYYKREQGVKCEKDQGIRGAWN